MSSRRQTGFYDSFMRIGQQGGMQADTATRTPRDERIDNRGAERFAVAAPVRIGADGGVSQPGALLDISTDGFRVEADLQLAPGSDVWLRLPGLMPSPARIIWRNGDLQGALFVHPLDAVVLRRIVADHGVAEPDAAPGERSPALTDLIGRLRGAR